MKLVVFLAGVFLSGQAIQATVYSPPTNWPANSSSPNPSEPWTAYTQTAGADYTDVYTLGSFVSDGNYTGNYYFGENRSALVGCHPDYVRFLTWSNGRDAGSWAVLDFTVPQGFSGTATITGTTSTDQGVWNYIRIGKLNAQGTEAQELGSYNITLYHSPPNPQSALINIVDIPVVGGDRIVYRVCNANNSYNYNNLTGYQIELVPEPVTLGLLGLGGVLMRRRK